MNLLIRLLTKNLQAIYKYDPLRFKNYPYGYDSNIEWYYVFNTPFPFIKQYHLFAFKYNIQVTRQTGGKEIICSPSILWDIHMTCLQVTAIGLYSLFVKLKVQKKKHLTSLIICNNICIFERVSSA